MNVNDPLAAVSQVGCEIISEVMITGTPGGIVMDVVAVQPEASVAVTLYVPGITLLSKSPVIPPMLQAY